MRLLVTRPQPEADRTAARLRTMGHAVLVAPLLAFEAMAAPLPLRDWGGILITSASAIRALERCQLPAGFKSLPLLAVGETSAEAARAAGFERVQAAAGDAGALVTSAAAAFERKSRPLLYLAGEQRAHDLATSLASVGMAVETVVVYRMVASPELAPGVAEAFRARELEGVLHFSKRTAEIFVTCAHAAAISEAAWRATHYCLSPAVAAPLRAAGATRIAITTVPNETALLALIEG